MTEPPVISEAKPRMLLWVVWAALATLWALGATGLAAVLLFQARTTAEPQPGWTRWEQANGGNGHWFKAVLVTNGVTWAQAAAMAAIEGGYLATVASAAE